MFFFGSNKEKSGGISVLPDSTNKQHIVLPDPHDIPANRELELARFKWNSFLASKPTIFDSEDWLWENRVNNNKHEKDGPIKKKLLQIFNSKVKLRKQVKSLIRSGIPPEYRGRVWYACSGAKKKQTDASASEQYSFLLGQIDTLEGNQIALDIDKDLLRTFPDRIHEPEDNDFIAMLRRVLQAYALRNPLIGYCQSMNYICALLLFHIEEEKAFWVLASLLEDIIPNNYYVPSLLGGRVDQQVFQSCIAYKLPRLFAAFRATNTLLEPIICPWFLCLYINVLPLFSVCRVWDCLFWEGNIVLFRIGLTLIKSKTNAILSSNDFISIYAILKANNMKPYSFELESPLGENNTAGASGETGNESGHGGNGNHQIMSETEFMIHNAFGFRWLKSVPSAKVEILRKKFTDIITKEEEKRTKSRNEYLSTHSNESTSTTTSSPSHTPSGSNDLHTTENAILKQPSSPSNVGTRRRRKSELMAILLSEKE
jgi:hypothetical protein